ncbi:MAG: hypothetical protein KAH38_08455 [Candidatus Hydrogenedentes bacterium]|nr:hypothetical protein [Candidatus Hydrogenedentota bacterium]
MDVPKLVRKSIGSQSIVKGDIEGQLKYFAWDAVPNCTGPLCPAYLDCTFQRKEEVAELLEQRQNGLELELPRCGIMRGYLESVTEIIFRNYAEDLTETQLYRIGMGLVPQYRQLCRLQIEELGLNSVLYTTEKGDPRMHPLLGAIREQISVVEKMWHSIGLHKLDEDDMERSNNVYDAMNNEAQNKINAKKEARGV